MAQLKLLVWIIFLVFRDFCDAFKSAAILPDNCQGNALISDSIFSHFPPVVDSSHKKIVSFVFEDVAELVESTVGQLVTPALSAVGQVIKPDVKIISHVASQFEKHTFSLVLNLLKFLLPSWFDQTIPLGEVLEMYSNYLTDPKEFHAPEEECNMNTPELISHLGYTAEVYQVITKDGYLLEIHRISHGKDGRPTTSGDPVFLQHGLLSSSADWVVNLENQSLAFMLADSGYDVWLGNIRGNVYCRTHANLTIKDEEFWNFSWQEMVDVDVPAMIDYILKHTSKEKITYIGHSMGSLIGLALLSSHDKYNDKIHRIIALSPITSAQHCKSIAVNTLITVLPIILAFFRLIGWYYILDSSVFMHFFAQYLCSEFPLNPICIEVLAAISGDENLANFNNSRAAIYFSHTPSGASVKTFQHFAQTKDAKKFQKFDYGAAINCVTYKQPTPPTYDLGNIRIPVTLIYGRNDLLAPPAEVHMIEAALPIGLVDKFEAGHDYSHVDPIWGMMVGVTINNRVIRLLDTERKPVVSQ